MTHLLDIGLTMIHILLMIFNLTGWIWPRTRKLHLITLIATATSWFILGIWYGFGYCPLTDWHWSIKERMGETNLPNSFVKYIADKITGNEVNSSLIDAVTIGGLLFAITAAVYVNFIKKHES
jgi:hypothetical protein